MCRHLAYVGTEIRVGELVSDPPFALTRQAWAPRRQTHGTMNVDGFGLGWYAAGEAEPARHRGDGPVWGDETFADLARVIRTTALLAAVRSGTEGMVSGRGAAAPFRSGRWLFSHNGALPGWPESGAGLVKQIDPVRLLRLDAPTDAATLWALTLEQLEAGCPPGEAVAQVVQRTLEVTGGRVNLLLTDGRQIAGSTAGASLSYRQTDGGVVVASEAYDDAAGWHDVPDGRLITVDGGEVSVHHL
ncbi:ergothioneine biosynthesis protein EgtC [Kineosporia babensis]|uniref:Gamma-glutamyl-hercynylcysteine sulfoxide hydrolase n=1 Tax=Kineosporia babensis TaxID=499548 RepID=A0A9X1SS83_9ACTN|nr:ergothioneine biosynthesis protein EgtC [Kineosporia babensis]MCD5309325.1 ergothioneine biosynthesis protein EgtC [Kineosporia babensis]